jgi:hypothetical protein|tara:strand:+ start:2493 stop:2753 length:261 start_codon:yes stop_codon:yes gene_type:complete
MAIKVDEQTEVRIPLKTLIIVIASLLTASWYVFTTQQRLHALEINHMMAQERFTNYVNQPSRSNTDIQLIKKDIDFLKQVLAIDDR